MLSYHVHKHGQPPPGIPHDPTIREGHTRCLRQARTPYVSPNPSQCLHWLNLNDCQRILDTLPSSFAGEQPVRNPGHMSCCTLEMRRCRHQGTFPQLVTHKSYPSWGQSSSSLNDYCLLENRVVLHGYGLKYPCTPISSAPFEGITGVLPPLAAHIVITHTRACLLRPTASALTQRLDLGGPVYSRMTSHQVQCSRDTCLGHDGVSSRLHSRPRGAAFRLSQPSVARTYHSAQHNLTLILVFLFWAVDAPKCDRGPGVVVRLSSLRKQAVVQPFAQIWIRLVSSETPRRAVALIVIHSNSSRFHESLFCHAGEYRATRRQFSDILG